MPRIVILMVVVKMTGKSHLHHHRRKEYKVCSEAAFGDFESMFFQSESWYLSAHTLDDITLFPVLPTITKGIIMIIIESCFDITLNASNGIQYGQGGLNQKDIQLNICSILSVLLS